MQESKTWTFIEILLIIFSIITLFLLPVLSSKANNLEDGDHLASTLAPVLSLVSSLLVYLAFKTQIKANDKIQMQFEKQNFDQNFFRLIDNIEKRLNNSEIVRFDNEGKEKGYAILDYIIEEIKNKNDNYSVSFGKYILVKYPEKLENSIWEKFYNEIDGNKYKSWKILKKKFINSDISNREKIISVDLSEYSDYENGFHDLKIEVFNTYFYEQSLEFYYTYYNNIYGRFFAKYVVFFDSYFKSISMILKQMDSIDNSEFYKDYLNDNLTTYEKIIIWMAVSTGKFGEESRMRLLKFEVLSALGRVKGVKPVPSPEFYQHVLKLLKAQTKS